MAAQVVRHQAAALSGRGPRALAAAALAAALASPSGCASHAEHTRPVRSALDAGQPELAVEALDDQMHVGGPDQLPSDLGGDAAVLLLDRASVHLSLAQHTRSKRDFEAADKAIDLLDLSSNAVDTLGAYLYSGSSARYQAPPHEKLLINTLNLLNYLETGDVEGGLVEARRIEVMRRYLIERQGELDDRSLALSSFLAGFAYERSGDADEALRYYDEALSSRGFGWLRDPVRSLLPRGSYRTERLEKLASGLPPLEPLAPAGEAEIVLVIGSGRVPPKIAVRMPIGLALTYFSDVLRPDSRAAAHRLAAQGLVTWVNYPTLGPEQGGHDLPVATLDGQPVGLEEAIDVTAEVRREWKKAEGAIVASAITRMVARYAAGEGARAITGKGALGVLASLGTQAALASLDTPDTRSWETLPARIVVARVRVPAGRHQLWLGSRGSQRSASIDLLAGGYQLVSLFALR